MSTRDDATLTEAERAAFARLQAQAVADDPSLGAPLVWRATQAGRALARRSGALFARPWAGPLVIVVGVIAVVAGFVAFLPLSMLGLVLVAVGAIPVVDRLLAHAGGPPPVDPPT